MGLIFGEVCSSRRCGKFFVLVELCGSCESDVVEDLHRETQAAQPPQSYRTLGVRELLAQLGTVVQPCEGLYVASPSPITNCTSCSWEQVPRFKEINFNVHNGGTHIRLPLPLLALFLTAQTCPQLFGCSAKANLGPTLKFFREDLGGSREEVRELVLSNPTLLRSVRINKKLLAILRMLLSLFVSRALVLFGPVGAIATLPLLPWLLHAARTNTFPSADLQFSLAASHETLIAKETLLAPSKPGGNHRPHLSAHPFPSPPVPLVRQIQPQEEDDSPRRGD